MEELEITNKPVPNPSLNKQAAPAIDLNILNNLSEEERKLALSIFEEMAKEGNSETFSKLLYEDYEEIPVDINTFIEDDNYLGQGLVVVDEYTGKRKQTVFPYWINTLNKIFPDNLSTSYNTLVLSGAIGLGKSFVAVVAMLYMLYRTLCLRDPYKHYGLQPIDHITFSVMNITLDAAKGVAWSKLQELVQSSPWFMTHGTMSRSQQNPEWQPNKNIELIYGSQPRHVIGRAVFCSFEDEISFMPNQDVEKQKQKAKTLISSIDARMSSRFMKGEKLPTLHILASSKRTDQSFLETYIDMKKKNESKTTLIIDEPQWVIRTDKDSPNKFAVAVGNKFLDSEVLPLDVTEQELKIYRDKGYTILMVPMGYRESFVDDIDIALTDIAGISTSNSMNYISGVRWAKCRNEKLKNPFDQEVLVIGNGPEDTEQYYQHLNLKLFPSELKSKPMFIHLDMSMSGDKTGIAGVWIRGKKPHQEGIPDSKELFYQLAFSVSIKAPKGRQVSFEKNRQLIYWLKDQGFNIRGVSFDTFQSADLSQQLKARGFDCSTISVDRVQERICKPYLTFKNAIYEERVETYDTTLLTEEIIGLVRDGNGKIDHSPAGINCFTGDTLIKLVDGRVLSILDLKKEFEEGKTNYVYSFNEKTKHIEPKPIEKVFKSGENASLLEVTLDDGSTIRCTPEHRFMLRDGSYKEAQYLTEGESLMPLYTKNSQKGLKGYRMYYEPIEDKWHYEHRSFAKDIIDEKYLVHHKDCNPQNNNPDNLVWCSKEMHHQIHNKMQTGAQSKESKEKRKNSIKEFHSANKSNPKYWVRYHKDLTPEEALNFHLHRVSKKQEKIEKINKLFNIDYENLSTSEKRYWMVRYNNIINKKKLDVTKKQQQKRQCCASYFGIDNYEELDEGAKRSLAIKYARIVDPSYQKRVGKAISLKHKKGLYKNATKALAKCNAQSKKLKELCPTVDKEKFKQIFGFDLESLDPHKRPPYIVKYRKIVCKDALNHKVKSVKTLNYKEDVYDLTIVDNHNFALGCGIIVHNSKDQADAVCGALYNASLHAEEYAYDFGETAEQILYINDQSFDEIKQLTLDMEDELKKLSPIKFQNNPNDWTQKTENYSLIYDDILPIY